MKFINHYAICFPVLLDQANKDGDNKEDVFVPENSSQVHQVA